MKLETLKKRLKGFRHTTSDSVNQTIVVFDNGNILLSYNTIIAIKLNHQIYLTDKWDYSQTTGRHRNDYLGIDIVETRIRIKDGTYKLLNE